MPRFVYLSLLHQPHVIFIRRFDRSTFLKCVCTHSLRFDSLSHTHHGMRTGRLAAHNSYRSYPLIDKHYARNQWSIRWPISPSVSQVCDVVTINCPLHPETEGLFNKDMLSKMKRGAYIVNTARGKICDRFVVWTVVSRLHHQPRACMQPRGTDNRFLCRRQAIVDALENGQLAGYAGDVWFPQPAPKDHPWRSMPHHGMTPHMSGTSLSAQARYVAGMVFKAPCQPTI